MRFIKAVAILMGILIVGGFAVLIWRMYDISSKPRAARPAPIVATESSAAPAGIMTSAASPVAFGAVTLGLPAGCEIAQASADSGRLVLLTSCGAVHVRDLATGAPLGTVGR